MAVGKVGSFATVEPAIVDFGGMAKSAIDSVKEDRERKRREQEAARAKKQQLLDKLSLPEQQMLNVNGIQDQRYNWYRSQVSEFARLKEEGDYNGAQRLINSLESEANAVKQTNAKLKYYSDNEGKLDPDYLKQVTDLTNSVDKASIDIVDKGDGELRYNIYKDPSKKELLHEAITPFEYISKVEVPFKFDPEKLAESFSQTFRDDEIETFFEDKGKLGTIKVEDVLKNERILNRIDTKANELVNDNTAMAFYGKTISKFEPRAANYTDEEKEDAKKYWKTILSDAYRKKIDISIQQKRGGGAGGSDVIQPSTTQLIAPISLQQQNAPKVEGLRMNLTQGSKLNTKAGEATILGVFYDDKNDKLYSIRSEGASASTGVSGKDARGGTSIGAAKTPYLSEDLNEGQTDISSLITGLKLNNRAELISLIRQNYKQPQETLVKFN